MIKVSKKNYQQILTDEELEFLAKKYIKLQQRPEFKKLSRQFRDFINEYLQQELLAANDILHKEDKERG